MNETTLGQRYAKALFEIASEENMASQVEDYLFGFKEACKTDAFLMEVVTNRFFDLSARLRVVEQVAQKLGCNQTTINFFRLLVRKGRMVLLDFIVLSYHELLLSSQKKLEATVTSAKPLPDGIYKQIEEILSQKTGQKVVALRVVKADVLGGLSISVGGLFYDGTVLSELQHFETRLKNLAAL